MQDSEVALFERGLALFNEQEFFPCHDVWEELWTDTLGAHRDFFQGLIQAAVALFHFGEGNLGGARRMYESARRYLAAYPSVYMKCDLARFKQELAECFGELLQAGPDWPENLQLDNSKIPRLHRT